MKGPIKDFEGNAIEVGDAVTVLVEVDSENPLKSLDSLKIGEVIGFKGEGEIKVRIGEVIDAYDFKKVSKIRPDETLDDMIIRIANNLEVIKLMQESDTLDSMLQGDVEEVDENTDVG